MTPSMLAQIGYEAVRAHNATVFQEHPNRWEPWSKASDIDRARWIVAAQAIQDQERATRSIAAEEAISDLYRIANELEHWAESDRDLAALKRIMRTYAGSIRKRAEALEGKS